MFRSRQHSAILWIHPSRHFRGSGSWYVQHLHLPLSISLKFLVRACLFPSPNTTPDATGKPWEYLDGRAVRNPGILEPKPVFDIEEWTIAKNISDINVYLPFIYDQGASTCNGNVRAEENGMGSTASTLKKDVVTTSIVRVSDPFRNLLRLPTRLCLPSHLAHLLRVNARRSDAASSALTFTPARATRRAHPLTIGTGRGEGNADEWCAVRVA